MEKARADKQAPCATKRPASLTKIILTNLIPRVQYLADFFVFGHVVWPIATFLATLAKGGIAACVQKDINRGYVPVERSAEQSGSAHVVAYVGIGPSLQEVLNQLVVARASCLARGFRGFMVWVGSGRVGWDRVR